MSVHCLSPALCGVFLKPHHGPRRGLIGKVTKSVDDNEVEFEIAPNVRARLARSGIAEVRAKGEPVKDATPPAKSLPAKKDAPNP